MENLIDKVPGLVKVFREQMTQVATRSLISALTQPELNPRHEVLKAIVALNMGCENNVVECKDELGAVGRAVSPYLSTPLSVREIGVLMVRHQQWREARLDITAGRGVAQKVQRLNAARAHRLLFGRIDEFLSRAAKP